MQGVLTCWDGRRIILPDVVRWKFQYGCGTPCDSFQLTCLWEPGEADVLAEAVGFTAAQDGETVFTGVVDECERGWDSSGGTAGTERRRWRRWRRRGRSGGRSGDRS